MYSCFFPQVFSTMICINKEGHFTSVLERPLNEVHVKRVYKSCIREHSDEHVRDHN